MRNIFIKICSTFLILSFIIPSVYLAIPPKKAEAIFGIGDITFDPSVFAQSVISAANTTATSFSTYSLQYKAFVLDTLATMLAKQLIRSITADVVNWINRGFEGSPSFLSNPGSFFLDVADQFTGEWLSNFGGPLNDLCHAFSIDIRLALAFKYHQNLPKKYRCTLSTIIENSKDAVTGATINGASIKGFIDGDFNQGGWPAFVSLTTEPQNNPYGSYLSASADLGIQVARAQAQQRDEITTGRGFFSWRDKECVKEVNRLKDLEKTADVDRGGETEEGRLAIAEIEAINANKVVKRPRNVQECPIHTPGSVIETQLQEHIGGPIRELQLVDSINEIVNALAAQLVNQVLQKGLKSVSGTGPSDTTSYINQIQAEAASSNNSQFVTVRNDFLKNIETYIKSTLQFKTLKDQSWNTILDARNTYELAKACFDSKIQNAVPPLNSYQSTAGQKKIADIDAKLTLEIGPYATTIYNDKTLADSRYDVLIRLRNQANNAKTLNEMNSASVEFSQLLQTQNLVSPKDIGDAQEQLEQVQAKVGPWKTDAEKKITECDAFPTVITP